MVAQMMEQGAVLADLQDDPEMQERLVRKALKTHFEGSATYRQGDYIEGSALVQNLGHGDIAMKLNRFIAPGAPITLELDCLTYHGLPIVMTAEVETCESSRSGTAFIAIVHVHRNAVKAA